MVLAKLEDLQDVGSAETLTPTVEFWDTLDAPIADLKHDSEGEFNMDLALDSLREQPWHLRL